MKETIAFILCKSKKHFSHRWEPPTGLLESTETHLHTEDIETYPGRKKRALKRNVMNVSRHVGSTKVAARRKNASSTKHEKLLFIFLSTCIEKGFSEGEETKEQVNN